MVRVRQDHRFCALLEGSEVVVIREQEQSGFPTAILKINEMMLTLEEIYAGACCMEGSPFKKAVCWIFLGGILLVVAACISTEPWWKNKPVSQMTPAEQEEQDPTFWKMWGHLHGLGN